MGITTISSGQTAKARVYDSANRLARTTTGTTSVELYYDGEGNLVRSCATTGGTPQPCTDLVVTGTGARTFVVGATTSGLADVIANGPAGSMVLSSGGELRYTLADAVGSTLGSAGASGTLQARRAYDAFGAPRAGQVAIGTPGFGGELEPGDGTVFLRARAYDPSQGRLLQRDTFAGRAGRPGSLNRYSYVEGRPLVMADPSGHSAQALLGCTLGPVGCGVGLAVAVAGTAWLVWNAFHPAIDPPAPPVLVPDNDPAGTRQREFDEFVRRASQTTPDAFGAPVDPKAGLFTTPTYGKNVCPSSPAPFPLSPPPQRQYLESLYDLLEHLRTPDGDYVSLNTKVYRGVPRSSLRPRSDGRVGVAAAPRPMGNVIKNGDRRPITDVAETGSYWTTNPNVAKGYADRFGDDGVVVETTFGDITGRGDMYMDPGGTSGQNFAVGNHGSIPASISK